MFNANLRMDASFLLRVSLDLGGVHSCLVVGVGVAPLSHDERETAPMAKCVVDSRHLPETTITSAVVLVVLEHRCGGNSAELGAFAELPANHFPALVPRTAWVLLPVVFWRALLMYALFLPPVATAAALAGAAAAFPLACSQTGLEAATASRSCMGSDTLNHH